MLTEKRAKISLIVVVIFICGFISGYGVQYWRMSDEYIIEAERARNSYFLGLESAGRSILNIIKGYQKQYPLAADSCGYTGAVVWQISNDCDVQLQEWIWKRETWNCGYDKSHN